MFNYKNMLLIFVLAFSSFANAGFIRGGIDVINMTTIDTKRGGLNAGPLEAHWYYSSTPRPYRVGYFSFDNSVFNNYNLNEMFNLTLSVEEIYERPLSDSEAQIQVSYFSSDVWNPRSYWSNFDNWYDVSGGFVKGFEENVAYTFNLNLSEITFEEGSLGVFAFRTNTGVVQQNFWTQHGVRFVSQDTYSISGTEGNGLVTEVSEPNPMGVLFLGVFLITSRKVFG